MKVKIARHVEHIEEYRLEFKDADVPGAGSSFPCDSEGNVFKDQMHPAGLENLEFCLANPDKRIPEGVVDYSRDYTHDAIYECDRCGGDASFSRHCAAVTCHDCYNHLEKARCWCGWSASGGNGYQELIEMGETIEEEW